MDYTIIIIFLLVFILLFVIYIVIPHIAKKIMRSNFLRKINAIKNVVLTFDDGPDPRSTVKILKLLKEYKATATFFVTADRAKDRFALLDNISDHDCEIGSHSYYHNHPWKTGPVMSLIDFYKSNVFFDSLSKETGKPVRFRPPNGKFNIFTLIYFLLKNMEVVFWDIDPEDYKTHSPKEIAKKVISDIPAKKIILLHDGRNASDKDVSDVSNTVMAVEIILKYARDNDIKISSFDKAEYE